MGALWIRKLSVLAAAAVVGVTGATVAAQAAPTALNWGPVSTSSVPPTREFGAMSFDSTRNRTVLWGGGNSAFVNLNDTWEFDGATWVQRTPATSPPALVGSAMAFDSKRGVSVMFGGSGLPGNSAATWEWDGTNWTLRTFATSPSARLWTTMAYDSTRGKIVLFGGDGAGSVDLGDTWEYDGVTWTHMTPANSPSARFGAAMAYDPGLGRVVLFGGRPAGQRAADTWEWDGTNWTQFTPTAAPFPRFWHSMAFDPQVGHVVVFGGDHIEPFGLGPINDTWEWDGTNWTQDWTNSTPSARAGQTMALDANGRIVMFGGSDEGNPGVFPTDTEELGTGIVTPAGNPAITFNPTSQTWGNVDVGTTSGSVNISVLNSGTGPLLGTFSTTGDFAISSSYCPDAPNPLAAGMVCLVFVTFTPTTAGDRFGALVLAGNVPGGSVSVPLHGVGLASDFSISASPTTFNIEQGAPNQTSVISTTALGAAGTVALSALTNDPGVTATFSPTSISAGSSSTMTIVLASSVGPGFYGVRVVGTEGLVTHYVDVSISVIAIPDFSIAATPTSSNVVQGSSVPVSVSTTAIGSVGSVTLSAAVSPAGLTTDLSPVYVAAGSNSTLTVSAGFGTPAGIYTVTVTGTEGSINHSISVVVTVTLKGIVNGGFETGDFRGWTAVGVTAVVQTSHSGAFAAQVGSVSPSAESFIAQTFTVPTAGGKLTFWYRMVCSDKVKNDWFTATLADGVTGALSTVQTPICSKTGTWTKVTFNVSSHAGHSVTLTFVDHDDGVIGNPTYTLVDDVSLS